jgi:hypothetical protein
VEQGADVVMVTCSTVGGLVRGSEDSVSVPLLQVDRPMAEQAVRIAGSRLGPIGVVATIESTVATTTELLRSIAEEKGVRIEIEVIRVLDAAPLVYSETPEAGWAMVADAVRERAHGLSAIVFAQMSTAASAALLSDVPVPKLTSSGSGVAAALERLHRAPGVGAPA